MHLKYNHLHGYLFCALLFCILNANRSEQKCYAKQNFAREDIRTTTSIGFFNIDNGPIINICNL